MKRLVLFVAALVFSALAAAAVNINTATREELDALPGIGPVRAQAIIDYRNANGPFKSAEDIMKVKGIKNAEFGKLRDSISVTGASTPPAGAIKSQKAAPMKAAAPAVAPAAAPLAPAAKALAPALAPAAPAHASTPSVKADAKAAAAPKAETMAAPKAAKAEAKVMQSVAPTPPAKVDASADTAKASAKAERAAGREAKAEKAKEDKAAAMAKAGTGNMPRHSNQDKAEGTESAIKK